MFGKFDESQKHRYFRHIILPEVGERGQLKLHNSKVLCIGAGGLGSPVIQYLAAAGVGTLGIIDDDSVDLSNLQRQVIHGNNIGKSKVISASEFVSKLNPDVAVIPLKIRVNSSNILDIINDYEIVADCSDNFATRYLVNDACVLSGIPLSHGSIFKFEGQVTTILPGTGPCYRCIFKYPPPQHVATGVFGVLPGVIGAIQATEIVKYLLDIGELLVGRMIYYDVLNMSFDEIRIQKSPDCPVCGEQPEINGETMQQISFYRN